MAEIKKKVASVEEETRDFDYRERFEFRLTVGDNIICRRYFKIGGFNPTSFHSFDLADTIRNCGMMIDKDLKEKSQVYLEIYSPRVFENESEMWDYFSDGKHKEEMRLGEGIVFRTSPKTYTWGKNEIPVEFREKEDAAGQNKFDDRDFKKKGGDEDRVNYKISFYDNGEYFDRHREVCSYTWEGVYPKFVRNQIDLSNKKRFDPEDIDKLSFEQYLLYKMTEGRSDLVYRIIRDICYTCSNNDNSWYDIADDYKPVPKNTVVKEQENK